MATKSGPCGRCVGPTRGETARQSSAECGFTTPRFTRCWSPRAGPRRIGRCVAEPLPQTPEGEGPRYSGGDLKVSMCILHISAG
eukprot:4994245-Prymnesium_polylepis.1